MHNKTLAELIKILIKTHVRKCRELYILIYTRFFGFKICYMYTFRMFYLTESS